MMKSGERVLIQPPKSHLVTDVVFGGAEVKKGSYALLTKPGMSRHGHLCFILTISTDWSSYAESDVKPITVTSHSD